VAGDAGKINSRNHKRIMILIGLSRSERAVSADRRLHSRSDRIDTGKRDATGILVLRASVSQNKPILPS
jgi:hypothetical protein